MNKPVSKSAYWTIVSKDLVTLKINLKYEAGKREAMDRKRAEA